MDLTICTAPQQQTLYPGKGRFLPPPSSGSATAAKNATAWSIVTGIPEGLEYPHKKVPQDYVSQFYFLSFEKMTKHHNALSDAKACALAYLLIL